MSNLTETSAWAEFVNKIEDGEAITEALLNAAAQVLANRTRFLLDDLAGHKNATNAHSATSAATASRLVLRDANGRAKMAAPSAADDIARKDTVDAVQTNLTNHIGDISNPHSVTAAQVGSPPTSRTITAGNGLTGGGDLSANRTLTLGTPSTLSGATSNGTTTGSHTHALSMASQAQAEAGSDSSVLMSPLRTQQAIDNRMLGVGQTWQHVSRSIGTTYINSTSRPIQVKIMVNTNPYGPVELHVGPTTANLMVDRMFSNDSARPHYGSLSAIVPPGWRYLVSGSGSIHTWAELR